MYYIHLYIIYFFVFILLYTYIDYSHLRCMHDLLMHVTCSRLARSAVATLKRVIRWHHRWLPSSGPPLSRTGQRPWMLTYAYLQQTDDMSFRFFGGQKMSKVDYCMIWNHMIHCQSWLVVMLSWLGLIWNSKGVLHRWCFRGWKKLVKQLYTVVYI